MKTYGYVRVSTADQAADDKTSLETQRRRVEGMAAAIDLRINDWVIESGVSGSKPLRDRPNGAALWEALASGDNLIAAKLDRLFRSASDALATAEDLRRRGVSLYILDMGTEPVTSSSTGRMFFGMLSLMAQFERERIAERTMDGKRGKLARGGHAGGVRPFGYQVEGAGRAAVLVPDGIEQEAILRIHEARGQRMSLRAISAELAGHGVKISHQGVKRVLTRPAAKRPAA